MKKQLLALTLCLCLFSLTSFGQETGLPFNFQGYSAAPDGKPLASTAITVKFTLYIEGNTALTHEEEHNVTTDEFGVFSTKIGDSTAVSTLNSKVPFQALNFHVYTYKLKVEVKQASGGSYTQISDEVMSSVPYAKTAENGVPTGTIVSFAGGLNDIPAGWVYCNGALHNPNDPEWQKLFKVLDYRWGQSGTDFRIPDLRGSFLRGCNDGSGRDPEYGIRTNPLGGTAVADQPGTYQGDAIKDHQHRYWDVYSSDWIGNATIPRPTHAISPSDSQLQTKGFDFSKLTTETINSSSETRPKNWSVYYIIKK